MSSMDDAAAEIAHMAYDLGRAPVTVAARAGTVVQKAVIDIQAGAQARAPVDTGALRSSISSDVTRSRQAIRGEVGPTVSYAPYLEFGTSRMRAQPFLRPATDAVIPGYEAALGQITEGLI